MTEPVDQNAPPWTLDDLGDQDEMAQAESPVRDENTDDMFGAPAPAATVTAPAPVPLKAGGTVPGTAYQVLARKYRPRTFEDLIGQEAMVRTLTNAFASGRIAHAFMLTGVRGVGKTTTARLLARALNFDNGSSTTGPSVDLTQEGRHCRAIIDGRHMDVLELDAASRTGVDDMRDLLDSVRYGPVEARYKVYVIDEVHMLSKGAFNALLKTLEEPPPHAKFIFATTEIRKVPVTILSRCQRFDLRRVEPDVLSQHLDRICKAEGALVDADGLALIARSAEGSVRDGLSLLDQAIVQADRGQVVGAEIVRDMLGLADRAQTIALFEETLRGDSAAALKTYRTLYGFGADPVVVMLDLLEHCHGASVAKALGPDALSLPKDQAARLAAVGAQVSAGTLARVWQMLLKAHEETLRAPDPMAAGEMALIRLCYASSLPGPEEALKALRSGDLVGGSGPSSGGSSPGGGGTARMMAAPAQPQSFGQLDAKPATAAPTLQSFEDVIALISSRREVGLKLDVERFMRPIAFRQGAITFEPAPGAPNTLAQRLSQRLKEWTGQPWLVAAEGGGGAESLLEREKREIAEERSEVEADPFVKLVMTTFPGAEIVEIRSLAAPEITAPVEEPDED
jgi:DNA polymerase-3 subunit gamma/tau